MRFLLILIVVLLIRSLFLTKGNVEVKTIGITSGDGKDVTSEGHRAIEGVFFAFVPALFLWSVIISIVTVTTVLLKFIIR